MRQITALLLFASFTSYGQTKNDNRVTPETIFVNAVENYLKYITESEIKSVDTLFVEQIDTINFNLPKVIQKTIVEVLPVSTIIVRLRNKSDPRFLRLQFWTDNKNKTDIIASERLCNYSEMTTEVIDQPENYRMNYTKKKIGSWKFVKTEKGTTGCRRFYKFNDGQLYIYKSICS
jgi:hypothetical protein